MTTQQVELTKFVLSYPSPPLYFTYNVIPPANVPSSGYATLSEQYNGIISVQLGDRSIFYDSKDYKEELKRLV